MAYQLKAGFSRVDTTPERYMPLGGYGDEIRRVCNNVLDRLYATCVAITDEADQTILMFSCDIVKVTSEIAIPAQKLIAETLGIPEDHIIFNATHTHAGPSVAKPMESIERYIAYLPKLLLKAAKEALEDRVNVTAITAGDRIVERMTFVRHYLMNDGKYSGPNFGKESRASGYKAHADKADEQLQVIRLHREDARDILLVNWQTHATTSGAHNGSKMDLSADYIGSMRNHLEGLSGCLFAFYLGACGNLVPGSMLEGEALVDHDHVLYGRKMAEYAMELLQSGMHPVNAGPVGVQRMNYPGYIDHSDDHLMEKAAAVQKKFYELDKKEDRRALLKENGFNSVHHAKGIVRRARAGERLDLEINALRVGDLGFATVPYEMFCSNGMFVKQNSPFPTTFMMTCVNGTRSYLADAHAFTYDCYEVNVRLYPNGIAEDIAQTLVDMLQQLRAE